MFGLRVELRRRTVVPCLTLTSEEPLSLEAADDSTRAAHTWVVGLIPESDPRPLPREIWLIGSDPRCVAGSLPKPSSPLCFLPPLDSVCAFDYVARAFGLPGADML